METVPRKAVVAVAFILVALAGLGAYQGWRRSSAPDPESSDSGLPTAAPVTGAKTASALTEPTTPNLTEAQVRDIARQEVRAALKPAAPAANSTAEDDAPIGAKPAALLPAAPTLQTPITPPPGQNGPNQGLPPF